MTFTIFDLVHQEDADDQGTKEDTDEDAEALAQKEADILAQLSADEIKNIMDSVFKETLSGLEVCI